ncbi:hypothetical protein [Saccharibacillus alkalitolerans]|uniref:Uncharacterized protein n=1 Tax=Saccharibacillus alkalitolerans TaxID=2705290 RepID=A0ABX0F978_9BACL|nr:hypothetical protein [Saccharibacillus alkalitolerans]NGZ76985.1 hypothetical protein [Saccharibacillus alkalitolerans]
MMRANPDDAENRAFLKIDKKYTPFLLKAIEAVRRTSWADRYDVNKVHISMREDEYEGRGCIVVRFYAAELEDDNWMEVTPDDIGGAHVYMDAAGRAVLHIAIER